MTEQEKQALLEEVGKLKGRELSLMGKIIDLQDELLRTKMNFIVEGITNPHDYPHKVKVVPL